ncbi:MAG: hypothetical protein B7Y41_13175 [Hydrogenophilales bacterium 28-61-23]|nr:MAG: hypothetical protein B7Y41_13175 [Hydrogenophilales bacterium 28-61-23]
MKTGRAGWFGLLFCASWPAHSAEWVGETVREIAAAKPGVFHHLDASGRNNLAVSGASVGLVWEDNRAGAPGCYLALKPGGSSEFREFPFGQGECFEPALAALDADRFVLIWEDAGGVQSALADAAGPGPATRLADSGGQGNVTFHTQFGAHAAWSAPDGRWRRVWHAPLRIEGKRLVAGAVRPADAAPATDDQTFPALAASAQGLVLAWEDRRHGHTVILGSASANPDAATQTWSPPARISGNPTGAAQGNLGRGTGAMRPALARFGDRIAAVWLDKRDFLSGYDVYAALTGKDGDKLNFAKDRKAQDSFGDAIAQWHAAPAGNERGDLILAWDDDRDGSSDIWLTRLNGADYGENFSLPAAAGPGRQSDPAIALDADGNLHLAWIERSGEDTTQVRYMRWPLPPAK